MIDRKLSKELVMGRILGPYTIPPAMAKFRVSPLGVIPKKAKGEFRMIHHLSYPEGESVNDFTQMRCHQLRMPRFKMQFHSYRVLDNLCTWRKLILNQHFG